MISLASKKDCTGCGACASICPRGCIMMKKDREGFLQPYVDEQSCIQCHKCESTCPILCKKKTPTNNKTNSFIVINKNSAIRSVSSSGGAFYVFANWTIEHGGVVFGARFNEKWEVIHDSTESYEDIPLFMGSKYVQSFIGDTFKKAKEYLDSGRWVLFSGTPCQLGGLLAYLGEKKYERLIQVDIVCHGVPSPFVWASYLSSFNNRGKSLERINFRDKITGWKNFSISYDFYNPWDTTASSKLIVNKDEDLFMKGFLNNYFLRRSCYECKFKSFHRNSDITLADAWGIDQFAPEMNDDKGASLVLTHSNKGLELIYELKELLILKEVQSEDVISHNHNISSSVRLTKSRSLFFLINKVFSVRTSIVLSSLLVDINNHLRHLKSLIFNYLNDK